DPVRPIEFPRPVLPEPHRSNASWHNYYDRHDILGYPLKPISPQYANAVTEDHEINVGGLIQSVTPLSHVEYWTDNTFVKEAAHIVSRFL
ncbi:MAG: hypothetical protein R3324_20790, partial [Halobacteriales archaeon]|nr:hypothetical protein [Halobacteriales archaeon]